MKIDGRIAKAYLAGEDIRCYRDHWIYNCFGGCVFEYPGPCHRRWAAELYKKLADQIQTYIPRNYDAVKTMFPNFDEIAADYTVMLVVGFPDPYDAMVLEHEGQETMVFDLIQFGEEALDKNYSCHRVLTHELTHMCLSRYYPVPSAPTYPEYLDYTAFNEGFAHALTYPENLAEFTFDAFHEEKFERAKETLRLAAAETDPVKRAVYRKASDTGEYWGKFASIAGKLYILKHLDDAEILFRNGWKGFVHTILSE